MAIKTIYYDPRKQAPVFEGDTVELRLSEDGAVQTATVSGQSVDISGLQGLIVDSKNGHFTATIRWPDGKVDGPFEGVQHVNIRVNYGMNVVELLVFERLQKIWYSQKASTAAAAT